MKRYLGSLAVFGSVFLFAGLGELHGQSRTPTVAAPTVFRMAGTLLTPAGEPRAGVVVMVASLYDTQTDVAPVWSEAQTVTLDPLGRYSILVGSSVDGGVPKEFFLGSTGHWLGVGVQGEAEQPRVMLVSVPYAVRALSADALGGKTLTDLGIPDNFQASLKSALQEPDIKSALNSGATSTNVVASTNHVVKYDDLGNSTSSQLIETSTGPDDAVLSYPGSLKLNTFGRVNSGFVDGLNMGTWDMFGYPSVGNDLAIGGYRTSQWQGIRFYTAGMESLRITSEGKIGVGTTTPQAAVDVANGSIRTNSGGKTINGFIDGLNLGTWDAFGYPLGTNDLALGGYRASQWNGIRFYTGGSEKVRVDLSGNVGIGTTAPTAKLDVNGSINVSGNINAKYQDVAEWVETTKPLEAGTVVIVDPSAPNRVLASAKAYDTRVAGAVSRQPGLVLGEASDTKAMVAQSGRVRIKVDASYGAVKVGDLFVTSPTPGYAMLSRPVTVGGVAVHRAGTLLGKALEALPNGKGEILVLLTLQ